MRSFFFGGLLPIIAFTVIEEKFGIWWGLIAGLAFGVGEISYELIRYKKVEKLTLFGNGLLIFMGVISLITEDGVWFKLQPAIFELIFAFGLWISLLMKKNILVLFARQKGIEYPEHVIPLMNGLVFRLGFFFLIQAGLATWAALSWSTEAWAMLKGIGVTVSLLVYMILEVFWMRTRIIQMQKSAPSQKGTDSQTTANSRT